MPKRIKNKPSLARVLEVYGETGSQRKTADAFDVGRKVIRNILESRNHPDFSMDTVPEIERSIPEIMDAKNLVFQRRKRVEDSLALRQIKINMEGPIAIAHFGDPHLDDDGTNIKLLGSHLKMVRDTDGMFAGSVGDFTNNWIGRLARLYGGQSVTEAEGWKLVEWMIGFHNKWMYLIGGNHDAWSGDSDPLKFVASQKNAPLQYHGARFELNFPNEAKIRINTRHDFKGTSQWNKVHGPSKAAQMGFDDHILLCGHLHSNGYCIVPQRDPSKHMVSHCIRVGSYKQYDDFSKQLGFGNIPSSPNCVTIIDPYETDPFDVVRVRFNVANAVKEFKQLRAAFKRRQK